MNSAPTLKPTPQTVSANPDLAHRRAVDGLRIDLALLLALLVTLAVQAFFMIQQPPLVNRNPPEYFYVFIPLVWALLTAASLAPRLRQRPPGSSQLPTDVALWLTAWLILGLAWGMIIFNRNSNALWGFWHYERLDPDEKIFFLTLVPLALAPGWFRLGRWFCLTHRQRIAPLGRFFNADRHARFRTLLAFSGLALFAWLFTDNTIASDGWGLIGCAEAYTPIDPNGFREYASLLLYRYGYRLMGPLGLYAADAIHIITFTTMLISLGFIAWLMRMWALTPRQRRLGWWLTLSTLGLTQMLMGHIEVYPMMQLGLIASLVTGVAVLRGRCHLGWCAVAYGLLLAFHLSGVFIFPAMALVTIFWAFPRTQTTPQPTRRLKAIAWMLGIGLLIHVPLWTGAMLHLEDPTPSGLIEAHLVSLNTGAEKKTFIGTGKGAIAGNTYDKEPWAAIFAADNVFKVVQVMFYTACAPLLLGLLIGLRRPLGWRLGAFTTADALRRREALVLFTAWLGYAIYTLTWHNDYSWMEDWDLFSGMASLSLLGTLFLLMPAPEHYRLPRHLARTVCLFALLLGLSQHYFFHSRGAYLDFRGKIALVRSAGPIVQRFQFKHGWAYGVKYHVKDGQVIVTKQGKVIPPTALNKHQ